MLRPLDFSNQRAIYIIENVHRELHKTPMGEWGKVRKQGTDSETVGVQPMVEDGIDQAFGIHI